MKAIFTKDQANKKIHVTRDFAAPLTRTWEAWTTSEWLDKWWAPKPWKAETKSMDFRPGGSWLYAMVGPEGEKHWSKADYKAIQPQQSFSAQDYFCDETGNRNREMPVMDWKVNFSGSNGSTTVDIDIHFQDEKDLNKIVEMGFEQGFQMGMDNLDEIL